MVSIRIQILLTVSDSTGFKSSTPLKISDNYYLGLAVVKYLDRHQSTVVK
jgi:hypothetical protein